MLAVTLMRCGKGVRRSWWKRPGPRIAYSWGFCLISVLWDEIFSRCIDVLYPFKNSDINMWACGNFTSKYSLKICEEGGSKDLSKTKTITYSLIIHKQSLLTVYWFFVSMCNIFLNLTCIIILFAVLTSFFLQLYVESIFSRKFFKVLFFPATWYCIGYAVM